MADVDSDLKVERSMFNRVDSRNIKQFHVLHEILYVDRANRILNKELAIAY